MHLESHVLMLPAFGEPGSKALGGPRKVRTGAPMSTGDPTYQAEILVPQAAVELAKGCSSSYHRDIW